MNFVKTGIPTNFIEILNVEHVIEKIFYVFDDKEN